MKIFVNMQQNHTRESFLPARVCARLEAVAQTRYNSEARALSGDALLAETKDADVLLTGWGQSLIDAKSAGAVKIIAHTGGTVNGIIDESIFDAGIKVISGNRYYAESVAEGVLAYMLFELRRMGHFSGRLKAGEWLSGENGYTEGLLDQTVGIISLGAISKLVIGLLKPFRAKIKVYSTRRDPALASELGFCYAELDEIFSTCKIVSLHTAANPDTYHMIGKKHFEMLADGSIFINTSRGRVIDEAALAAELAKNRFRAVLDVYETEPLPKDSPLFGLENVSLFPHQGGPTVDRRAFITDRLIDDVEAFFSGGEIKNEITREIAARMTKG